MVNKEWTIGKLLSTSTAFWKGCALQAGVRLDVFTIIGDQCRSLSFIAEKIGADQRGCEYLLNALSAMGLLNKKASIYVNSPAALEFLCKDSKKYIGYIILHHHHILDGWAQLDKAVITGKPVETRSYGEEIERESFLMGMFNLAMGNAPVVAAQTDLSGKKRLLDLGGGPGTYAIHFCKENPELNAVIFDRPTTEPFARKTVTSFGLGERIDFAGGDINFDSITGGPYDVAWLSHILHSNGPDECQDMINKTVGAMEPGGLIMIHEFILDNNKDAPEFAALFSINMLINNPAGRSYSEEELTSMLETAGVRDIYRHPFKSPNDSAILCGIK
ncbi:MAG: SAM-dependent methyltransferase [Proteobacteria bacterium]|nr:SAM-dependent methyltransferase [Pseudomonadota bacterium]MBU1710309.1 SAM-dependent methyltransferase [Pseudomonadota bacterium]